jgi:hypothetical protein
VIFHREGCAGDITHRLESLGFWLRLKTLLRRLMIFVTLFAGFIYIDFIINLILLDMIRFLLGCAGDITLGLESLVFWLRLETLLRRLMIFVTLFAGFIYIDFIVRFI